GAVSSVSGPPRTSTGGRDGRPRPGRSAQLSSIQKRTGKSLDELYAIIRDSGLAKHGEIRDMLKRDLTPPPAPLSGAGPPRGGRAVHTPGPPRRPGLPPRSRT